MQKERGQVVVLSVVVLMIVVALLIPAIVQYTQNESKWTLRETRTTRAFELAEAAVEQGYQQLIISTVVWTNVANGSPPAGFNFDQAYADASGGSYAIRLALDPGGGIAVTGVGRDKDQKELRAVKAIYSNGGAVINAALSAPLIDAAGKALVYWGPIVSVTSMDLKGAADTFYPRKYAGSTISGLGGPAGSRNYCNPPPPKQGPPGCPPVCEWYCDYPVPVPPVPDFTYYKRVAISQGNSCNWSPCYNTAVRPILSNTVDANCTTGGLGPKVWYFEGSPKFAGRTYFCGVLIALGNVEFTGTGATPEGYLTVTPPSAAWQEYQVDTPNGAAHPQGDTAAQDEYPGDGGYHTVKPFDFSVGGGGFNSKPVMFEGYVYGQTGFTGYGNTLIVGAVQIGTGGSLSGGFCSIFFQPQIIRTGNSSNNALSRASWQDWTGCSWTGTNPTCP